MPDLRHRIPLLAYLILAAAFVLAIGLYQQHVNNRLARTNKMLIEFNQLSCANRRILIINQQLVLRLIRRNIEGLIQTAPTPGLLDYYRNTLEQLGSAEERLVLTPVC